MEVEAEVEAKVISCGLRVAESGCASESEHLKADVRNRRWTDAEGRMRR